MTSGVEKLRELRACMDVDLERFRQRIAHARETSEAAANAAAEPVAFTRLGETEISPENCRPNTWLV
ncbi:MAG: hypothetical protein GX610_06800 [Rhodococcus sp.]|nr:hypothetical protein [Rhodococcus sp. (in: high G+C Gram-positive bacteria)]